MHIVISKIAEVEGGYKAIEKTQYIPGTIQPAGFSVPLEYTVEGELIAPIEIGKSVFVQRTKRNGVPATGFFATSPITEITENTFKTRNSVYTYKHTPPVQDN